ncbi:hypothetical protein TUM20985_24600 [Mycobacterium antarcticum]|uniref:hypothetical protein n=1 Tax=unclassified Mycolicibacterium TaxID=2636767 RepID=UPI00238E61DA|nr:MULTISPECIES: hypothetical protein [unclassified Mycolicibacterium]BDX31913.1 hypothetical protein TUM20985_24600 [Mycolicibacterium sp. TUM20985]GLP75214.1 hypothetical protein TUM20983_23240 [Mycolicibacterium sp. TUM20983]GLP80987.1 hypothetical protein TUM20984_24070 [Mycolicibacterium sp. TUM20984]
MSVQEAGIEALGDHDYLALVPLGEDVVTIRIRATPEVVAQIAGTAGDETRVVAATIAYLTARQRADDLPGQLDLEDVAAAYNGYVEDMRTRLAGAQ